MSNTVTVHIEKPEPRSWHAVQQVLEDLLGWQVRWEKDAATFASTAGPRLHYGHSTVPGAFHIRPAGLLHRKDIDLEPPPSGTYQDTPTLFPTDGGDLPYDIFSASFWSLNRLEEYGPISRDAHGRPITDELLAAHRGFLDRPVVDEWAIQLASAWKSLDPAVPLPVRSYSQTSTVDLDNGFMYLGRPLWRSLGSWARDLLNGRWAELLERPAVLLGRKPDPFDVLPIVLPRLQAVSQRTILFVLNAPRGSHDHAVPLSFAAYAARLRESAASVEIGVHPSYHSSEREELIEAESSSLARTVRRPVHISRQHFLRFRLPETYRHLEQAGIAEDHSMGLHDLPGFRAGTCTPYRWFDTVADRPTDLRVHPFTVMDNSLRNKMGLRPEDAPLHVAPLIARIRKVNGTFTGLWHEGFLSGHPSFAGWREAIDTITLAAKP